MLDYHLHSDFSGDGKMSMDELCAAAVKAGLSHIAITDHMDETVEFFRIADKQAYLNSIEECRARWPQLCIARGLELDFHADNWEQASRMAREWELDFALASEHYVAGEDPYYPEYYRGKTQGQAYRAYLEGVAAMSERLAPPFVAGHITYLAKFAPYARPQLCYNDYQDVLDIILRTLVARGAGMEVNTSGLPKGAGLLPGVDILARYRQLGGEILTVGSDAHDTARVGQGIYIALEAARAAGFGYICSYEKLQPVFHKI